MGNRQQEFYTGLESLLRYHDQIGLGPVVINDDIREFLGTRPLLPQELLPPTDLANQGKVNSTSVTTADIKTEVEDGTPGDTLAAIQEEVAACSLCNLSEKRQYPVAGQGDGPARLMIIGDWLALSTSGVVTENLLFGGEQDQMLFRMLEAMHVPTEQVFITNVIKCAVPGDKPPQAKHVQACFSYLKRQLHLLRPEFILTMGMVATRALLKRSLPLSRLRGRLHDYALGGDRSAQVLVTYHPSYLLQNPEMKKATWQDLQLLARKMGTL